jgi:hypothetical protein
MINKFFSIDNSSHKQKKYKELRGEIYLITLADAVWQKWKTVFERHESGDLINPDTLEAYNKVHKFKPLKPLLREFFRSSAGPYGVRDREGGNPYVAQQEDYKKTLGPSENCHHQTKILCSFVLHIEGVG